MALSPKTRENFGSLKMVADYVLEAPQCLLPPWTDDGDTHYPSRIVLSDKSITPFTGLLEARIVYEQDSAYDPRDEYAAVRRLTWDIATDWERCQSRTVVRPTISNECFRVDRKGLVAINRAMQVLAMRAGPFQFEKLILDEHAWVEPEGGYRIARHPARVRRVSFGTFGCRVDLHFGNKWVEKPTNASWEKVWRVLGSLMTEANSFGAGRFASHGMTPTQYARALAQEATQ